MSTVTLRRAADRPARQYLHRSLAFSTLANIALWSVRNKNVGPPYSRAKIYAASLSVAAILSISAARARPQQQIRRPSLLLSIDGTDGRMDGHPTVFDAYNTVCGRRNSSSSSTVELVDDTYTTVDESWLFTTSRSTVTL